MEEQKEIQNLFRSQQEKYTYYLIGLCVAAIGFSINMTLGQELKITQLSLAIALLCWGLSCYCGLKFISRGIDILFANNALLDVAQGKHELTGNHPQKMQIGYEKLIEIINKKGEARSKFSKWQVRLFFWGMISFFIWHVLEMYLKTK